MTDQDRFDNFISRAARDIDPVPETPRDSMWTSIAAERAGDERTEAPSHVIPLESRQKQAQQNPTYTWLKWGAPLAALLVITFGLGRISTSASRSANSGAPRGQQTVATEAPTPTSTPTSMQTSSAPDSAAASKLEKLSKPPIVAVAPPRSPGFERAVKSTRSRMTNSAVIRDNNAGTSERAVSVSYRFAASRHFQRVQTLLVTLPVDAHEGHINEIAVRAADLLVNTRLLLDSPAARDPETKGLLDDLELILAQAATISPTHSAEDVQLIQDAITKHDVLLRLRAITAGPRLSGT